MDNATFRRRPSIRPAIRRPSVRRPSDHRRPSVRRLSDYKWPSVRAPSGYRQLPVTVPSDHRQPSVRRPPDNQPSGRRRSERQPSVKRRSEKRPSYRSSASSSSETYSSTYTSEYYGSDEDEESEHSLSTTIKTNIQMEKDGLGFIIIQNGPYLQLTGLVEKSAAARDGKLQAVTKFEARSSGIELSVANAGLAPTTGMEGDVLLKIGHANVLGYTLRELRQLLQGTPIGTVLQIQVYRDFLALPSRWASVVDHIPEKNGADTFSDASEESWTSSEGTDEYKDYHEETGSEEEHQTVTDRPAVQKDIRTQDKKVHYEDAYQEPEGADACTSAVREFRFVPLCQPQWISRVWHLFERKKHTFTVGSDIGCDIMVHKDYGEETDIDSDGQAFSDRADGCSADGNTGVSTLYVRASPYWTLPKANTASSSSSSSLSEVFWFTDSAEDLE